MEPEATLKDWVQQHRVTWEIGPSPEMVKHRPQALGFELRLFGRHGSYVQPSPGRKMRKHCEGCITAAEKMAVEAERFAEFHRMRGEEMKGK